MKIELSQLTTEQRNPNSMNLDQMNTMEVLQTINNEDKKVALAVEGVLPQIEIAVEQVCKALNNGGRLFYIGAGTSGRLGVIDASECPPTFMTPSDMVQTIMAGGNDAFFNSVEGTEDLEVQGEKDLKAKDITNKDIVLGITASGRTPYPIGALKYARSLGAYTISLSCNKDSLISEFADCEIEVVVGPEVLTGSTRMKAATAHKMVLNMISTTTMVKLGKVHENLMVDVHASNYKLIERAKRTTMEATNISYEEAEKVLKQTNCEVKPAIVMIEADVTYSKAKEAITYNNGYVRQAIDHFL
ncbi:N-acetylmuramic acid 6-phosphate etherase [Virgibacillus natechei]|uniref:N-acetylmuramic acid 6-phosphate etherase n=1 Tax=Virgibacillus natechei TaxID=1216297 RepID=A0ABS4IKQ6_9BACI|nr:N-acetylmuramic acid 6-phosphate etherase [Virgibacillus natechei]MBP1971552.1 N-acetylmuramic acid 6-phosphate etherase [Virgibacillus natechei]UZD11978.1 N-acetylmuramic acid 6-phosphate etherase [Virgibacillus natechei]